jgi:hypothetical protein
MDTLVTVELNTPIEVKTRKEIIDEFANRFVKKELSSVEILGNITDGDQLFFRGYFVSRFDLIQLLIDICSDISIDNVPLQNILRKALNDPKVRDSKKNNVGVGVNFGYGLSREIPKTETQPKIRMSRELQLIIDTLAKVEPDRPSKMISSYTTANLRAFTPPISIPNGGTPYPNPII